MGARKVNPADAPVLILSLTSDTMTLPQMYDAGDSILSQKLAQVSGVGQVFVGGAARPAVRAEVNPNLLNKIGLGLDVVRTALNGSSEGESGGCAGSDSFTDIRHDDAATDVRRWGFYSFPKACAGERGWAGIRGRSGASCRPRGGESEPAEQDRPRARRGPNGVKWGQR